MPLDTAKSGGGGDSSSSCLKRALLYLCQMTGHRLDGLNIEKLEGALRAAAASMSPPAAAGSGSSATLRAPSSGNSADVSMDAVDGSFDGTLVPTTPHCSRASGQGQTAAASAAAAAATPATAARKAPRSRLAAMSSAKAQRAAAAALAPGGGSSSGEGEGEGDSGAAALAGLMADCLKLDEGGLPQSLRAPPLPRKPAPQRRVRFCGADGAGGREGEARGEGEDEVARAAAAVPPSVARHAVRRDQQAAPLQLAAPPAGPHQSVAKAASAACGRSRSCAAAAEAGAVTAATASAAGGCASAAGAGGAATWQPAVLLLLEDPLHQFPWESCPGVAAQHNIYRCACGWRGPSHSSA
jgi:hypothetical protein